MKTQIDFEKLCKEELGFEIVTDDFTRVAKEKGLDRFESYEYWETMDGDGIYIRTCYKLDRYEYYKVTFEDFDPNYFICTDPSYFQDDILQAIEYGETIFLCEDVLDSIELDFEEIAERNGLIEEEDEEV